MRKNLIKAAEFILLFTERIEIRSAAELPAGWILAQLAASRRGAKA